MRHAFQFLCGIIHGNMLKLLMVFLFFFGQMGLLTSFHILFDMPKEDIGNSNQPEREREDRNDIYPGRLSPKEHSTL